jgi:hypothetical protein
MGSWTCSPAAPNGSAAAGEPIVLLDQVDDVEHRQVQRTIIEPTAPSLAYAVSGAITDAGRH